MPGRLVGGGEPTPGGEGSADVAGGAASGLVGVVAPAGGAVNGGGGVAIGAGDKVPGTVGAAVPAGGPVSVFVIGVGMGGARGATVPGAVVGGTVMGGVLGGCDTGSGGSDVVGSVPGAVGSGGAGNGGATGDCMLTGWIVFVGGNVLGRPGGAANVGDLDGMGKFDGGSVMGGNCGWRGTSSAAWPRVTGMFRSSASAPSCVLPMPVGPLTQPTSASAMMPPTPQMLFIDASPCVR